MVAPQLSEFAYIVISNAPNASKFLQTVQPAQQLDPTQPIT